MSGYVVAIESIGTDTSGTDLSMYGTFRARSAAEAFAERVRAKLPEPPASDASIVSVTVWQVSDAELANVRIDGWFDALDAEEPE